MFRVVSVSEHVAIIDGISIILELYWAIIEDIGR